MELIIILSIYDSLYTEWKVLSLVIIILLKNRKICEWRLLWIFFLCLFLHSAKKTSSPVQIIPVCWWSFLLCFPGEEYEPSYYKLGDNGTKACLATGFSKYQEHQNNSLFKNTEAIRIKEDSLFNQVAFISSAEVEDLCEEGKNGRFNVWHLIKSFLSLSLGGMEKKSLTCVYNHNYNYLY